MNNLTFSEKNQKSPLSEADAAWAISILNQKINDNNFFGDDAKIAIDIAVTEIGKSIPKSVIEHEWSPNRCPTCDADLGGECNDGYYKNPWLEKCPVCGQLFDN